MYKNSIFIGIKGKKFDGNLFAKEAIENNATLAISNKKYKNSRIVFNKNPLYTFNNLSSIFRKSLNANNIAITGSSGKTSVKELIGYSLSKLDKLILQRNH